MSKRTDPMRAPSPASLPDESPPDEVVVQRVLEGDTAIFELLMRRHNQRVFRVVRSLLGDDAEAEDVTQEAYVRAFTRLHQFEGRARFVTWLTKVAIHEARARQRKRSQMSPIPPEDLEALTGPIGAGLPDGLHEASRSELRCVLTSAVDSLPPELRLVFTLRHVEGLDTRETADCLGLSAANVKVRLHRARLLLQSWIDQRIGEEARQLYEFGGDRCDRIVRRVLERLLEDPWKGGQS